MRSCFARQALAQPVRVEVGQDGEDRFRRLVDIDDTARLGKERRDADIYRKLEPVAIEDCRTRCSDCVARLAVDTSVGDDAAEPDEFSRDDRKDEDQREDHPADACACEVAARAARAVKRDGQRAFAGHHRHGLLPDAFNGGIDTRVQRLEQLIERGFVRSRRPHRQAGEATELLRLNGLQGERRFMPRDDRSDVSGLVEIGPVGLEQRQLAVLLVDPALDRCLLGRRFLDRKFEGIDPD
jgi:hypothetical protein